MTGQNSIIGLKWLTDLTLQMKTANKLCRMIWCCQRGCLGDSSLRRHRSQARGMRPG